MSKLMNYGLSALMEAVNSSESTQDANEKLLAAFEETIDDTIIGIMTNEPVDGSDDSVKSDMGGEGIGVDDEEKIKQLVDKIPPDDEGVEDQIEDLAENYLPALEELNFMFY